MAAASFTGSCMLVICSRYSHAGLVSVGSHVKEVTPLHKETDSAADQSQRGATVSAPALTCHPFSDWSTSLSFWEWLWRRPISAGGAGNEVTACVVEPRQCVDSAGAGEGSSGAVERRVIFTWESDGVPPNIRGSFWEDTANTRGAFSMRWVCGVCGNWCAALLCYLFFLFLYDD